MFQRIQQYPLISMRSRVYRPRAYGEAQPDGTWDGWLVFFPLDRGPAIASDRETTQSNFDALVTWAFNLTGVYLEGALERALRIAEPPQLIANLTRAEYDALEDAERLETAAELERITARADEDAAASARNDARGIRRERLAAEEELAATEEPAAHLEAAVHERAASEARAAAVDAGRRRRKAKNQRKRSTGGKHRE